MTDIKKKYLQGATEALTQAHEASKLAAKATKDAKDSLRYSKDRLEKAEEHEKILFTDLQNARKRYDFASADLLPLLPFAGGTYVDARDPAECFFATANPSIYDVRRF